MGMGVEGLFGKQWTFPCGLSFDVAIGLKSILRAFEINPVNRYENPPAKTTDWKIFIDWKRSGSVRFLDLQFDFSYVFPASDKK